MEAQTALGTQFRQITSPARPQSGHKLTAEVMEFPWATALPTWASLTLRNWPAILQKRFEFRSTRAASNANYCGKKNALESSARSTGSSSECAAVVLRRSPRSSAGGGGDRASPSSCNTACASGWRSVSRAAAARLPSPEPAAPSTTLQLPLRSDAIRDRSDSGGKHVSGTDKGRSLDDATRRIKSESPVISSAGA